MADEAANESVELTNRFLAFEEEYDVFDLEMDGVPIWERFRFDVHREIQEACSVFGQPHHSSTTESLFRKIPHAARYGLKSAGRKNPLLASDHDVLVWGHSRRKLLDDGLWWDLYFDPIYTQLDIDNLHVEGQHRGTHRAPAKTEHLKYIDFIEYTAKVCRRLGFGRASISGDQFEQLRLLEDSIRDEFDVSIDLQQRIKRHLDIRAPRLRLYRYMLERVDPNVVLLTVAYGRETFVEACQEMEIPVVELQHGVIHPWHLGYAYQGDRTKETFPDYLFVWGESWKTAVEYPIPDDHVIPIGYPYIEQRQNRYADVPSNQQILFISQGTIGEELSKFAVDVSRYPDVQHDVVYKLHPGEYGRWREAYPWLLDSDVRVIDSSEPSLYRLFAGSEAQVGVGSTAVYEGLCFDLETYVYDTSGSLILQPLVNDGAAQVVTSVRELSSKLGTNEQNFERERYFSPNAIENVNERLDIILRDNGHRTDESTR